MIKQTTVLSLIILIWVNIGCQNKKEDISQIYFQQIDSLFNTHYELALFSGGVVITHNGETIYENYLGLADRSWDIPINKDTKFDIASVNKSIIAALILKAVEEGRLNLEDKLVNLLSSFSYEGSFHSEITLHQMLCHCSGLPDYGEIDDVLKTNNFLPFKRQQFSQEEYVNFISKIKPINKAGKQFYYSNFAYHLLSIILEKTYQMPFRTILKDKLTRPLNLKNTVSESSNEVEILKLAKAYNYQKETGMWHKNQFIDLSLGRRVFSTAYDLNKWAQIMDKPGWLTAESLKLMTQNHLTEIDRRFSYGYGWVTIDNKNESSFANLNIKKPYIIHGGSTEGYKAMLININKGEYVISFLSNVGNQTKEIQLAQQIVNIITK